MCLCLTGFDSPVMSIFALFVMAFVSLPVILRKKLSGLLGKFEKTIKIVFTSLLWIYIISVIFFWVFILNSNSFTSDDYVNTYLENSSEDKTPIVLVFGCRTYGYTPGKTLKLRLDKAYELLSAMPDSICVVSGGQGPNETVSEAVAMKYYLEELGIEPERIITESASTSTKENILFTKQIILENNINTDNIIGVSTAFHLPRIKTMSERYGLEMELCGSDSANFFYFYVSMVREYLSYIKMSIIH